MRALLYIGAIFSFTLLQALTPKEAFDRLIDGNKRFCKNKTIAPNQEVSKRLSTLGGQSPFAVIVACSDSRVAPEILFDQGIGDLFVIRVAGNVVGPLELESILYAVKYLGSSCILVMGHESCGAVNAVLQGQTVDVPFIGQVIRPAVLKAKMIQEPDLLKGSIKINAEQMRNFIQSTQIVSQFKEQGKVDVYAAYYNFVTGAVEIL